MKTPTLSTSLTWLNLCNAGNGGSKAPAGAQFEVMYYFLRRNLRVKVSHLPSRYHLKYCIQPSYKFYNRYKSTAPNHMLRFLPAVNPRYPKTASLPTSQPKLQEIYRQILQEG